MFLTHCCKRINRERRPVAPELTIINQESRLSGYRHFHLDDCWANHERTPAGDLIPDTTNFPNGLTPVIDYAHSKGLAFGLYTSGECSPAPARCLELR